MNKTKSMILAAILAAVIFLFTAYVLHIPIGTGGGYMHFGDTFIYIAAVLLPFPYALLAGAIGAGLADFACGFPVWIPFTIIIKPLMALCFTSKGEKILGNKRNIAAPVIAGILCRVSYYFAEVILFGNFITPLAAIPGGLFNFFGSMALYFVFASVIDSRGLKGRLL